MESWVLPQSLPQSSTRSVVWSTGIQWPGQEKLQRKLKKNKQKETEEERPQEHPVPGWILGAVLHPNILTPRATRGTMAEPGSALDIPSEHSAMGSHKVWWLSHTTEGCTNHSDQIRRSAKITQDQGEELKPLWGQQWWQHISESRSGEWVISGFPLQI